MLVRQRTLFQCGVWSHEASDMVFSGLSGSRFHAEKEFRQQLGKGTLWLEHTGEEDVGR